MRTKIIAVNAVIVLIVGLLSFALVRSSLSAALSNTSRMLVEARHEAQGVSARVQLVGLRAERWVMSKVTDPSATDLLAKADPTARSEGATQLCNTLLASAKNDPAFTGTPLSLIVMVDKDGKIVGRNGSSLSRGEDLRAAYPGLREALEHGNLGSEVWANSARNDQFLASYAPVRNEAGHTEGAVVVATTLNDVLSRVADSMTGRGLWIVVPDESGFRIVARSSNVTGLFTDAINGRAKDVIQSALTTGDSTSAVVGDFIAAAVTLGSFGDGREAILVTSSSTALIDNVAAVPMPILGATALGVILVIAAGMLIASYITRPINMLEEGLLAILNGQTDKRFELQHDDLGGLAFRIDQLLNQLMGVEEDTTDAEGHPAGGPQANDFTEVMAGDPKASSPGSEAEVDSSVRRALAAEVADAYYSRIYREYIDAKKAFGEAVDHIDERTFVQRIKGMEKAAEDRVGKPVRYQVKPNAKEVVLVAVRLS